VRVDWLPTLLNSNSIESLRELDYRLSFEADEWGESREYLTRMKVQMRCGH
jgi:hypothetical protein